MYNVVMARASTTSDPFNAIAEPRRRHILEFIAGDERSVTDIADALELGQPSVSKHLQVLRDVGLVQRAAGRPADHVSDQRGDTAHDSRLERHVRAALARTAATNQGTRRGGTMTTLAPVGQTFTITEEILVRATLEKTFASLIAQMGRLNETPDGKPLPMVLEPRPGGRWFRELGGDNGHLWGFVQSIKRPDAARDLGTAVHVHRCDLQPAVPVDRSRRRLADHVHPHAAGPVSRGSPAAARRGMDRASRARAQGRRNQRRRVEETTMAIIDALLAELEQESLTTRRVLERVPQAHLSWKPHPKSMSLGQLALHVATVPGNVAELAPMDTIPEPPAFVQPEAATAAELVPALTASVAKARHHLGGFDDAAMGATWRLMSWRTRTAWRCRGPRSRARSC